MEENQNELQCNICVIKASLSYEGGKTPEMPYRVIEIPKESSLELLAIAVLAAFEFDFTHAFGFYDNLRNWTKSDECYVGFRDMESDQLIQMYPYETSKSVRNTQVGEVFDIVRKKMLFLYDYGDEWHFILQVKKFITYDDSAEYPAIVESVGKAPMQYDFVDDEEEIELDFDD